MFVSFHFHFHLLSLSVAVLLLLLLHNANVAFGAKVLFTFFHDTGSHFSSMLPLMEKLARDGHQVHMLDTIFINNGNGNKSAELFQRIHAKLSHGTREELQELADLIWNNRISSMMATYIFVKNDGHLRTLIVEHPEKASGKIDVPTMATKKCQWHSLTSGE